MVSRYAYLPFVGLFIIAIWGSADLLAALKVSQAISTAMLIAVLAGYASVSYFQIHYWQNSYALFSHAIQVTNRNAIAENNLGQSLLEMGKPDLALLHFEAAAEFLPQYSTAHYNLAVMAQQRHQLQRATREYALALAYGNDPMELAQCHSNFGFVLADLNQPQGALEQFNAALRINPDKQNSLVGRGMIEYRQGNKSAALADFSHAVRIAPMPVAYFWLGRTLEDIGQLQAATRAYRTALQLAPNLSEASERLDAIGKKPQ
jgi:tetratricopeptide (TPR) repeat protein